MEGFAQILKPSKVRVEANESNLNRAQITIEPLDRGFGYTLGNALRRVLLSSMSGCAIVEVRLENVLHEYTAIEGVKEDVTNILLNLKEVAIAMHARDVAEFTLKKQGPGVMVAGDIEVGHDGEVINPDHVIANLTGEVEVSMTIKVMRGRGYQVSAEINAEGLPYDELDTVDTVSSIGSLRLDASFSPVRRVSYEVQSTRVEKRTDLDKLTIDLETNGTITPKQALGEAAGILIDQFAAFAAPRPTAHESTIAAVAGSTVVEDKAERSNISRALLSEPIEKLGLSQRSTNRLKSENIYQIGSLVGKSEMDLLKTPSFGQKSLAEVQAVLSKMELSLGMDVGDWTPSSYSGSSTGSSAGSSGATGPSISSAGSTES